MKSYIEEFDKDANELNRNGPQIETSDIENSAEVESIDVNPFTVVSNSKKQRQNSGKQSITTENAATNQEAGHISTANSNTAYIGHTNPPQNSSENTIKITDHEIKAGGLSSGHQRGSNYQSS